MPVNYTRKQKAKLRMEKTPQRRGCSGAWGDSKACLDDVKHVGVQKTKSANKRKNKWTQAVLLLLRGGKGNGVKSQVCCRALDMARGQQKIQSQQKNAKKQAGQKKKQGHDQKAAAKAALIYTCTVCRSVRCFPLYQEITDASNLYMVFVIYLIKSLKSGFFFRLWILAFSFRFSSSVAVTAWYSTRPHEPGAPGHNDRLPAQQCLLRHNGPEDGLGHPALEPVPPLTSAAAWESVSFVLWPTDFLTRTDYVRPPFGT
ncbi:zinc finger protein 706 [Cricetulus griseus]